MAGARRADGNVTTGRALLSRPMIRNVIILHRGDVVATIPVELDGDDASEFVAEAIKHGLRLGTFQGRDLKELDFQVSAPPGKDRPPAVD